MFDLNWVKSTSQTGVMGLDVELASNVFALFKQGTAWEHLIQRVWLRSHIACLASVYPVHCYVV